MIEAEIVEDYKVVELKQAPIILYDAIEKKSKEVTARIQSLNIEELEATEDNLRVLKTTRTELSKELKNLEEQRKLVKDLVMKPYNDFEEAYKKKISDYYKRADVVLKEKIDYVEDKTLQIKIDGTKNYFDECNTHEFIKFEDLELKIIKSKSDKSIKDEIDDYLAKVGNELNTIDTLENKDRVLAKYQMHKDLNRAISETNIEIERERKIEADRELAKAREEARQENISTPFDEPKPVVKENLTAETPKPTLTDDGKRIYKINFGFEIKALDGVDENKIIEKVKSMFLSVAGIQNLKNVEVK